LYINLITAGFGAPSCLISCALDTYVINYNSVTVKVSLV